MKILEKFSLKNKVALVTGGYGYLGRPITAALAEAGATVIVGARNKAKFNLAYKDKNPAISFIELDIADTGSVNNAVKQIINDFGQLDILVNNAFFAGGGSPEQTTGIEWQSSIDGTLNSVYRCLMSVLPYMKARGGGNIINISSMYGMVSPDFRIYEQHPDYFNPPGYGAAKAGIIQLTRYFAVYLARENIRVNCISPGAFPVPNELNGEFIKKLENKIPLGRVGNPDELKGVTVFLASDASSYITGENVVVDGGWTVW